MRTQKWILVIYGLAFAVVLTACGGGAAAPAPTPTPSAPDLSASAVLEVEGMGKLTLNHPANWKVVVTQDITMSNNADVDFEKGLDGDLPDNAVFVQAVFFPIEVASMLGIEGDVTPVSVLNAFKGNVGSSSSDAPSFGDVAEVTINGKSAARTIGSSSKSDGMVLALVVDDAVVIVLGGTKKGGLTAYQSLIEAIAGTAKVAKS